MIKLVKHTNNNNNYANTQYCTKGVLILILIILQTIHRLK